MYFFLHFYYCKLFYFTIFIGEPSWPIEPLKRLWCFSQPLLTTYLLRCLPLTTTCAAGYSSSCCLPSYSISATGTLLLYNILEKSFEPISTWSPSEMTIDCECSLFCSKLSWFGEGVDSGLSSWMFWIVFFGFLLTGSLSFMVATSFKAGEFASFPLGSPSFYCWKL